MNLVDSFIPFSDLQQFSLRNL